MGFVIQYSLWMLQRVEVKDRVNSVALLRVSRYPADDVIEDTDEQGERPEDVVEATDEQLAAWNDIWQIAKQECQSEDDEEKKRTELESKLLEMWMLIVGHNQWCYWIGSVLDGLDLDGFWMDWISVAIAIG